jgi:hypothetical protein
MKAVMSKDGTGVIPRETAVTWMWPIGGDTSRAAEPNTGTMRRFSARYWMTTRLWASESASGRSMSPWPSAHAHAI